MAANGPEGQKMRINSVVSDSLIRIELITHFHRNPGLEGTSMELADMIGRERSRVEGQMKKLVQLHILDERLDNGECYYRYIPPHCIPLPGEKKRRGQEARAEALDQKRETIMEGR
jgi:predicted transcriptional regulator